GRPASDSRRSSLLKYDSGVSRRPSSARKPAFGFAVVWSWVTPRLRFPRMAASARRSTVKRASPKYSRAQPISRAPVMMVIGMVRSSELQVDDLAHPQAADGHEHHRGADHHPPQRLREQRCHVAGADEHEHRDDAHGHGHQDVGGELAFRSEGGNMAFDFVAFADGSVDLVQHLRQVPAYFTV